MNSDRITYLIEGKKANENEYVLYYMQQSARVFYNHALLFAIEKANEKNLPLVICFIVNEGYLGANRRHYQFMLEGIKEVSLECQKRGITFIVKKGDILSMLKPLISKAALFIMDYGYLKHQLEVRRIVYDYLKEVSVETYMVESDLLIPVRKAYPKLAYGAYVLRPHILKKRALYRDFNGLPEVNNKMTIRFDDIIDITHIEPFLDSLNIDHSIKAYKDFKGGYSEAKRLLNDFIENKVNAYEKRNDPSLQIQSYLSIYLHFGQISVLEILDALEDKVDNKVVPISIYEEFFEQLIIRRELSFNFVTYQPKYDDFYYMTEKWAYDTMEKHLYDPREYVYSKDEIENSKTHDAYFNMAMKQMRVTGFMASYLRMYWAKKIMEWSISLKEAYDLIVYLNNKYFLDGRDANTYQNIAWCFGKADRPWQERAIFGTLRFMNSEGLRRKFNIEDYVSMIEKIEE